MRRYRVEIVVTARQVAYVEARNSAEATNAVRYVMGVGDTTVESPDFDEVDWENPTPDDVMDVRVSDVSYIEEDR